MSLRVKAYFGGRVFPTPDWVAIRVGVRPGWVRTSPSSLRSATRAGSTSPSWSRLTASATPSNGVGWAFTITRRAPVGERDLGERGGGVDAERRAEREEQVGARPRPAGPARRSSAHEVLAEADRGRLQDPAALEARRDPPRRRAPGRASRPSARASRTTRHFASCTVPWISTICSGTIPAAWCSPSMFWVTSVCSVGAGARAPRARGGRRWARRPTSRSRAGSATRGVRTSGSDT